MQLNQRIRFVLFNKLNNSFVSLDKETKTYKEYYSYGLAHTYTTAHKAYDAKNIMNDYFPTISIVVCQLTTVTSICEIQ